MKKAPRIALFLIGVCCFAAALLSAGCHRQGADTEPPTASARPITKNPLLSESSLAEEVSAMQEILRGKTVILDPGHGFGDTGCIFPDGSVCEKDLTPVLISKVRAMLEEDGVTVLQTHDGNSFPTASELHELANTLSYDLDGYLSRLIKQYSGRNAQRQAETIATFKNGMNDDDLFNIYERSYCANLLSAGQKSPAALFVSIHVNANANSSALSGFELYSCTDTPYAERSRSLMQALESGLQNTFPQTALRKTAWDWEEAFAVNKYPDMPSVLIESGYATNPTDAANLQNEEWQNAFARAVANGIELFLLEE